MGITVTLPPEAQTESDIETVVEYSSGDEPFRLGFPLTRISDERFVGSLFWLDPGKEYNVQVSFVLPGSILHCTYIEGSMATRTELTIPEPTFVYVVDPDGSGDDCIEEEPCSLNTGIGKVQPGEALYLRGGIYYTGNIQVYRGGREGAPILIRSFPGEEAIFDGAETTSFEWQLEEPRIYSTRVTDRNTNLVFADGVRLYPYKNFDELKSFRWNLPGYYLYGNKLYVHLENEEDPSKKEFSVSRYSHALWITGGFTYLIDLTFQHYSEDRFQQGAVHLASDYNLIQDSNFINTNSGIAIEPNSNRNVIQHNTFQDVIFDWSWDAVYNGTHFPSNEGIRVMGTGLRTPLARGNIIRYNEFHDVFDGMHICPDQQNVNSTNETDVYENLVYRVVDDGMETDGFCSNVRIWGNTFHDVLMGISLAPAGVGPTYAIRNLIYNTGVNQYPPFGNDYPCCGNSFKFSTDKDSGYMYLMNNTTDSSPGSAGIRISGDGNIQLLFSRNNTWIGKRREALKYTKAVQPLDFDYDLLLDYNSSKIALWQDIKVPNLQSFQNLTGMEFNAISEIDPGFIDPSNGDYQLLPDSKLIDAGVFIPGINFDFSGGAPDIGAFEYVEGDTQ